MNWGTFAAALVVTLVAQKSLVWTFGWSAVDLLLVLALLCGLNAPAADARIAGWLCGFAQDLAGQPEAIGVQSLSLGLTVMLLVWMREAAPARVWWLRPLPCLVAAWIGQIVYLLLLKFGLGVGFLTAWNVLSNSFLIAAIATLLALVGMTVPAAMRRNRRRTAYRW
ncbi:MAG: hypothetical protein HZB38_07495 [Planctomycetes bacterium]|nr:hypothetical protein [Planctomycetota bacterium]